MFQTRSGVLVLLVLASILLTACGGNDIPALTKKEAMTLRNQAIIRFADITMSGGCSYGEIMEAATPDYDYYYFCEKLNTLEKLTSYLEEVFTGELTEELLKSRDVKVINNRLAFSVGDWGSMNDWANAKVNLKSRPSKDRVIYEFIVPDVDGNNPESIEIEYVYVPDKGWRVVTAPRHYK